MPLVSINPTHNIMIREYPEMTGPEIEEVLQHSQQAFQTWRQYSFSERGLLLKYAAKILRENANQYAKLMAEEMGKPIAEGRGEAEKCAWVCEYYADHAEGFLQAENMPTEARQSYVTFQPLGTVLAIMPWNFPFWQVFRFAAPALMAGNVAVLKHASNVSGCALAIEKIFQEARFPNNVFRTLLVGSNKVDSIIANPRIAAVTLTGSTAAGKAVAAKAGSLIKKTVLELGGSDPYIILEDADLPAAVTICVAARLKNSGQSCIAAKRFIVVESIYNQFVELFTEKMQQIKMGDPLVESSHIGPQAREDLRKQLHEQVQASINKGAKCVLGGFIPDGKGFFYPPTVLTEVKKGVPAYDEELFGPVAAIIKATDERQAISIANDTVYGLGAAIFTRDIKKGERLAASELQAGSCFVNAQVQSDPRLPFGGIKESGYGRELSHFGIQEFVNIKTVFRG